MGKRARHNGKGARVGRGQIIRKRGKAKGTR